MNKWMLYQLGRDGYPFKKFVCVFFIVLPTCLMFISAGYAYKSVDVWLETSSCQRTDILDLNTFEYKNPEALTDKELACLIAESNWPSDEWENAFKHVYCESSKIPHQDKRFGKKTYYGLFMLSEDHAKDFGLSSPKIFYIPKEATKYAHKLWKKRKWQPWYTDSTKATCIEFGPNMDGDFDRDGWAWAEPTFVEHFQSGTEKIINKLLIASN